MLKKVSFTILILFSISLQLLAQNNGIIKGVVKDQKTGRPLANVNCYIDNSTIGTTTDAKGNYKLENLPSGVFNVIFTDLGYVAGSKQIVLGKNGFAQIDIDLKPQIYDLGKVQVTGKTPARWKRNLAVFKREFLGNTSFSTQCIIRNPEVLDFGTDPKNGALTAHSDSLLIVDNNALGYRLIIHLNDFNWSVSNGFYTIHPFFKPMKSKSGAQLLQWERNRKEAYKQSLRHFLYALIKHNTVNEGYHYDPGKIKRLSQDENMYQLAVRNIYDTSLIGFKIFTSVDINYKGLSSTIVKANNDYFFVDSNGNLLNPKSLELSGDWSLYRVGSMLPFNYKPGN